jgi:hypothetical protein
MDYGGYAQGMEMEGVPQIPPSLCPGKAFIRTLI